MVEADVTNLAQLRNSLKDEFKQQEGLSLSFFPFFAKAVIQALKKNPKSIHLGMMAQLFIIKMLIYP